MREILFRGKRIDNEQGVEGYYICLNGAEPLHIIVDKHGQYHRVDQESVSEFCGLTDKNGKKIFEGDIVTGLFLFGMIVKAVVAFQDGAFGLKWYRGEVEEFNAFTSICNVEYEAIGNIYDNLEENKENG